MITALRAEGGGRTPLSDHASSSRIHSERMVATDGVRYLNT
jgi:hypothetical protein